MAGGRYAEPRMSRADQDEYFAQSGEVAKLLDADPVPRTRGEAEALIAQFRHELRSDDRSRAFRDLVLHAPAPSLSEAPVRSLLMSAAVDLMPDFREGHARIGQAYSRSGGSGRTLGIASTLRWAFGAENYRRTH
jgi:uncharacterized protein (DUF2236 family)